MTATTIPVNVDSIPAELRDRPQWILWRDESGRKMPYSVSGGPASSTDPVTWTTFDAAVERYSITDTYSGLGYVFSAADPYCGIDLDGCRHPDGTMEPWANKWVSKLESYTEVSPSGTGVKVWTAARNAKGIGGNKKLDGEPIGGKTPGVEIYDQGRFFTVTGQVVEPYRRIVANQTAVDAFVAEHWPKSHRAATPRQADGDRQVIVERARNYVAKMPPAVDGQNGSRDAFAVACVLFRFGLTDAEADSLFREFNERCVPPWSDREIEHKLADARQKVTEAGEFGAMLTTERPMAATTRSAPRSPALLGDPQALARRLKLVRLDTVTPQEISWLWQDRLAAGKITLLAGDAGLGKSTVTSSITAAVTRGWPWPDGAPRCEPGTVLILAAEDGIEDTLVPRLIRADADLTRVQAVQGVEYENPDLEKRVFNFARDMPALVATLREIGNVRLLIVDPVSSYLDGIDTNKNGDVRSALQPLVEAAQEHSTAVLLVTHLSKASARSALAAATGSLAFGALARQAHLLIADPDDPSRERRLLLCMKTNICRVPSGLAFTIDDGRIEWEREAVAMDADEAMRRTTQGDRKASKVDAAKQWLESLRLDQEARPAKEIRVLAEREGISYPTLKRAFDDLNGVAEKQGFQGGYTWRLPNTEGIVQAFQDWNEGA